MFKMGILAIIGALVCGCVGVKVAKETTPKAPEGRSVYSVLRVAKANITIDGRLDEPIWQKCQLLTDFSLPWEPGVTPQKTEFRAFCDAENLYFAYKAFEETPMIAEEWTGKTTLNKEDRVEIYFSPDWEMKLYYCIEIDPLGRVHDFRGTRPGGFDSSWTCEGLKVAATRGEEKDNRFYIVEGLIPLKTLRSWGMPENMLPVGLFRADLERTPYSRYHSHWMSWVDLRGHKVSFHMPEALGVFEIQD